MTPINPPPRRKQLSLQGAAPRDDAQVRRFSNGQWLVFRQMPKGLSRKIGGARLPRYRHPTEAAAIGEAKRLLGQFPESSFIIMREVAVVKVAE